METNNQSKMTDQALAQATKLFRSLDDELFKLREARASHQTQEKHGVDLILTALRAARAEVWREAARFHQVCGVPCVYCESTAAALEGQEKEEPGEC